MNLQYFVGRIRHLRRIRHISYAVNRLAIARTPSPVAPADHVQPALYGKSPSSRYAANLAEVLNKVRQEARRCARACRIRPLPVLFSSAKLDGN